MTYSKEWDEIYAAGKQITRWPWSDLVSAVSRHCGVLKGKHVLELGCGPGGNRMFFEAAGADYLGIDGSWFPDQVVMDFTKEIPDGPWDLIFDRAAVTHNDTDSIRRCLGLVFDALKPGGIYIGIDWFSTSHDDAHRGEQVDLFTRTNVASGQFKGVGKVHFSSYAHLMELFCRFEVLSLAHKIVSDKVDQKGPFASWNIVARKL